ncbi:MAG: type II secretion system minor pseudopilin GspK [Gammaproteobacteria bacterium]
MRRPPQRQRGIVLLAALFVVVLATTFVSNLLWSNHLETRRTRSLLAMEQGAQYALAGEAWAAEILNIDRTESEIDTLEELWAATPPAFPIDGGQIVGQIEDLQGRFNLNNLINSAGEKDEAWFLVFQRLLESLTIEARVADQVVDWLDPDQDVAFPNGAEDDVYTGSEPAYRTPNSFITHPSELLAIEAITREVYQVLAPHVATLPPGTLVNINTATGPVIAALSETLSVFDAEAIIEVRTDQPFAETADLDGYVDPDALGLVSFSTDYFQVLTVVSLDISRYTLFSVLERNAQTGTTVTRLRNLSNE